MDAVRVFPLKGLAVLLGGVIVLLQYRLWLSDDGVRGLVHMRAAVAAQQQQNAALADRNHLLAAEVRDLKTGTAAIEERARSELGMIGANETYYQVAPGHAGPGGPGGPASDRPGAGGHAVPGRVGSPGVSSGPQVTRQAAARRAVPHGRGPVQGASAVSSAASRQ